MSWTLVGQIAVLTLLALVVLTFVAGVGVGLVNHWKAERDEEADRDA